MTSTLYDRNGEVIGEFFIQKRVFVDIEDMPKHLKNVLNYTGVDPKHE